MTEEERRAGMQRHPSGKGRGPEASSPISATERERRRRSVRVTTGNQALEGLHLDAVETAEDEEWINGEATLDELIQRAKERHAPQ